MSFKFETEKIQEEKIIKEHINVLYERRCELCNCIIAIYKKNISDYEDISNRDIREYELKSTPLIPIIGMITDDYGFLDCGGTTGEIFDVCNQCYEKKVKPLFKKQFDIEPRVVEYNWSL